MGDTAAPVGRQHRLISLVGPYLSGKTTLLEAILARTNAIPRQGTIAGNSTIGDASPEARAHAMSVEMNIASAEFMGDQYTFLDCPGSIEFQHEAAAALIASDVAVVVCEPDPKKVPALQLILRQLEDRGIPHLLFLNKIDKAEMRVRDLIPLLQPASRRPLVLRQVPIWKDGIATGFVDLALERAFVYREHAESEVIDIPQNVKERETEARYHMLEQLADYDDQLMEQLLSDIPPPRDKVFDDLTQELRDGKICPVLIGSAEHGNGILRLMKALRHDAPRVGETAKRLGLDGVKSVAYVVKTLHTAHGGKMTVARVLAGEIADSAGVRSDDKEERVAGVFALKGQEAIKRGTAKLGETVALGRLESILTGDTLTADKAAISPIGVAKPQAPVFHTAIAVHDKKDEVKLTAAVHRIIEEDPSLSFMHSQETGQMVLSGQGEMHLRVAREKLMRKYGVHVDTTARQVPYKETIRKSISIRGRHKKQSGGHGQFGDVMLTIKPLERGEGFQFEERIVGGAVPRNFFGSVEIGVADYLKHGPLGFQVVDVHVALVDGSYHSVDSSDMAFRQAARIAMQEGMPDCAPVLLEPVMSVEIAVPSDATAKINGIIPARRGQILGFNAREGWDGWDLVLAQIPEAEIQNLIIELRSATSGVGTFTAKFDHLAEISGRIADQVLAGHAKQAA